MTFLLATNCSCNYEMAVEKFGLPRICEFFGFDRDDVAHPSFVVFLQKLFNRVSKDFVNPSTIKFLRNYITRFLLVSSEDHKAATDGMDPTHIRLGTSSASLIEVKYEGRDDFLSTTMRRLLKSLTATGVEGLIRHLLNREVGHFIEIGAGHKDDVGNLSGQKRKLEEDSAEDGDVSADCLKEVLLLASRDQDEKKWIDSALMNYEHSFSDVTVLLNEGVKSLQIGRRHKGDPYAHAMAVTKGLWIAICLIEGSTKKHCVLFNANDNTISDPVDEGHGKSLPRNEDTLRKLRIRGIAQLRPIIQRTLKKSTRAWLNNRWGVK